LTPVLACQSVPRPGLPNFKLSDEAAEIYQYEKEAYEEELEWQEHLDYLA